MLFYAKIHVYMFILQPLFKQTAPLRLIYANELCSDWPPCIVPRNTLYHFSPEWAGLKHCRLNIWVSVNVLFFVASQKLQFFDVMLWKSSTRLAYANKFCSDWLPCILPPSKADQSTRYRGWSTVGEIGGYMCIFHKKKSSDSSLWCQRIPQKEPFN